MNNNEPLKDLLTELEEKRARDTFRRKYLIPSWEQRLKSEEEKLASMAWTPDWRNKTKEQA